MANQTQTQYVMDAEIPIPRPVEKEDWAENAAAAGDELSNLIDHYGGIESTPALALCQFHAKWYMSAGHKALGRIYARLGKV